MNWGKSDDRVVSVEHHGSAGLFWFAGWLFTIPFAGLAWWQILLGIIIWPYYLGIAFR